jgi:hypothetical protein
VREVQRSIGNEDEKFEPVKMNIMQKALRSNLDKMVKEREAKRIISEKAAYLQS